MTQRSFGGLQAKETKPVLRFIQEPANAKAYGGVNGVERKSRTPGLLFKHAALARHRIKRAEKRTIRNIETDLRQPVEKWRPKPPSRLR